MLGICAGSTNDHGQTLLSAPGEERQESLKEVVLEQVGRERKEESISHTLEGHGRHRFSCSIKLWGRG